MIAALAACAIACTPAPPMTLPAQAGAAATATWILGTPTQTIVVPARRARAVARGLGDDLVWAEPNTLRRYRQAGPAPDPLSAQAAWRDAVVAPGMVPPPVSAQSPLLALIDSPLDVTHPEFTGGAVAAVGGRPVTDLHGTATAAVAAAPKNDIGILGIWPGMPALNVPLPPQPFSCADSAAGIKRAVDARAAVINMSYGSSDFCFAEYRELQRATAGSITLVAAAGNEFAEGNPLEFPGGMPHVITVAAVGPSLKSSFFSNANAAIDLSAPGEVIHTAVPPAFDEDGTADGYMSLDGTSFAAPMVAAAAAWVRAVRPQLSVDQVAQVIRLSARDLDKKGWDSNTGFGMLDLQAALAKAPPEADPLEPNDEILWIDGRGLGRRAAPIYSGSRPAKLRGILDRYEDPVDIYRIIVPARKRITVRLTPRFGRPEMAIFSRRAEDLDGPVLAGPARRKLSMRNTGSRKTSAYLAVAIDRDARTLDSAYTLTIR